MGGSAYAVAVILNPDGKILFLHRTSASRIGAGRWGLPGGHIEAGETPMEAMGREIAEEIGAGVDLELVACMGPVAAAGLPDASLHLFRFDWLRGEPSLNQEHTRFAWIGEVEFRTLDTMPGIDTDLDYLGIWPNRKSG